MSQEQATKIAQPIYPGIYISKSLERKFVLAAAGLVAGEVTARADVITLDVSATMTPIGGLGGSCSPTCTLGGDIVINNSSGAANSGFVSADVTVSGFSPTAGPFTGDGGIIPNSTGVELFLLDSAGNQLYLDFPTITAGSLVGYTGGALSSALLVNFSQPSTPQWSLKSGSLSTPLPATLPLFASGLGALGLLGCRRKRKARA